MDSNYGKPTFGVHFSFSGVNMNYNHLNNSAGVCQTHRQNDLMEICPKRLKHPSIQYTVPSTRPYCYIVKGCQRPRAARWRNTTYIMHIMIYYGVIQNLVGTPTKKNIGCSPPEKVHKVQFIIWGLLQPIMKPRFITENLYTQKLGHQSVWLIDLIGSCLFWFCIGTAHLRLIGFRFTRCQWCPVGRQKKVIEKRLQRWAGERICGVISLP